MVPTRGLNRSLTPKSAHPHSRQPRTKVLDEIYSEIRNAYQNETISWSHKQDLCPNLTTRFIDISGVYPIACPHTPDNVKVNELLSQHEYLPRNRNIHLTLGIIRHNISEKGLLRSGLYRPLHIIP
jgi:hypothetical protein